MLEPSQHTPPSPPFTETPRRSRRRRRRSRSHAHALSRSSKAEVNFTPAQMVSLYRNPGYLLFLAASAVAGVFLHRLHARHEAAMAAGVPLPHSAIVAPCAYATFSALFGTQSVVQAKSMAELVEVVWRSGRDYFRRMCETSRRPESYGLRLRGRVLTRRVASVVSFAIAGDHGRAMSGESKYC